MCSTKEKERAQATAHPLAPASISTFPPELLLEIFPLLPLKALIAAQGVSTLWRYLVPLAHLAPARRALLELYLAAVRSPRFLATRARILPHVVPFDREAYVVALERDLADRGALPADFRTFLLEWPSRAVIGRIWPGLNTGTLADSVGPAGYSGLANCFARTPKVGLIDSEDSWGAGSRKILAIELWWHSRIWSSWLVVDRSAELKLLGNVHGVMTTYTIAHQRLEARSWTDWLRRQLSD